jgi:UDP-GlcNAc3NAcA epimerase
MTTIATIVGARPQFIKAAVVSRQLRAMADLREVLVHTGQHYDDNMSRIFFDELGIPAPDVNLGIGSGGHGAQTGRMLEAIERVLKDAKPDLVLIYGDTNSTLAGALAAAKLHIPVAHVEAGLRSFNRRMPEEINRVVADCVADFLFAPTETAVANLRNENVADERIHLVGDVMYDAAQHYGPMAEANADVLPRIGVKPNEYVLATVHRAENTDELDRLTAIFSALAEISAEVPVVAPLHPRTRQKLLDHGVDAQLPESFRRIDPVGYLDMLALERRARLIVTDSGGVQKEAFFHRVGCVTLRDETEWMELVEMGCNRLVPPSSADVVADAIRRALGEGCDWPEDEELFGGGKASQRIAQVLSDRILSGG